MYRLTFLAVLVLATASCSLSKKEDAPPPEPDEKVAKEAPQDAPPEPEKKHWSYEGAYGPDFWGDLDSQYMACKAGKMQSPVDLKWSAPKSSSPTSFDYKMSNFRIVDTGQTVQVHFDFGNKATLHGQEFFLVHIQFHSMSEHTISGRSYPLEMQMIHKNAEGMVAIVSVMLVEGVKNSVIENIWTHIPSQKNVEVEIGTGFNPGDLMPSVLTHYQYTGSLTHPPCTEGVQWYVLNTPVEISKEQLAMFRTLYSSNRRPIQPLNGRTVQNF